MVQWGRRMTTCQAVKAAAVFALGVAVGVLQTGWTFGLLLLCIWASQGSKWWTFCTALMFLAFMLVKTAAVVGKRKHEFKEIEDLHAWVEQERSNNNSPTPVSHNSGPDR